MSAYVSAYVVVDIGCIECGEPTEVVGVYQAREDAVSALREYAHSKDAEATDGGDYAAYFDGGQHHVEVHAA